MSQATYDSWSIILQCVVGLAVIWYTIETNRIRKQASQQQQLMAAQIGIVQRQIDLSVAPYVVATAVTAAQPMGTKKGFPCSVRNMTKNLAHHIRVVISDPGRSGLYFSEEGLEVINEKETLPVVGPLDRKKVIKWLSEEYGSCDGLFRLLDESGDAFIAVFFYDLQNKVYMMKTKLVHKPQDDALYWGMSERFDGNGKL
jgi:hypothetical protein